MTVRENLAFGLRNVGMGSEEIARRVGEAARVLEIGQLLDRQPAQLSGGQRQRVAIGRAIVKEPRAFLFDEPLSNLDAALRVRTRVELAELHQRIKSTMIYVTHDQTEAMTLADRIVVLNDRKIEQIGTPMEVYSRPASRFVAGFVGSPAMNFLDVTVERRGAERAVALPSGLRLPLSADVPETGSFELGIRPESLRVAPDGGDLQGEATVVERLGDRTLVHVRLPNGSTVTAQDSGRSTLVAGERVGLQIDRGEVHLFDRTGRAWHAEPAAPSLATA
jgi:multiple sugar transport system ATP-binding protein